jgi:hypothetical protein
MSSIIDSSRRLRTEVQSWTARRIANEYTPPNETTGGGNDGRLYLPRHQRLWCWKGRHGLKRQMRVMDSLFHNYPVGTIIVNKLEEGGRDRYQIYDGRHRIETIYNFFNDRFSIPTCDGSIKLKYSELNPLDRFCIESAVVPVIVVENATTAQMADIFVRLNSGKALTDADFCWANIDKPLVASTLNVMLRNDRFSSVLGGLRFGSSSDLRTDLPHWIGLLLGIATGCAPNMTTSFVRLSDFLDVDVDCAAVEAGLDALFALLTAANTAAPLAKPARYRAYRKLGFINAFFLADWMAVGTDAQPAVIEKWTRVISHIRTENSNALVKVAGAQNLDGNKIETILKRVNKWIEKGHSDDASTESSDDDEEYDE